MTQEIPARDRPGVSSPPRDDRVLRSTRITSAVLVPVLLTAGVILYLFPDDTERLFAWPMRPRPTALVMGAGYFVGAYFFARLAFAARWQRAGDGCLGGSARRRRADARVRDPVECLAHADGGDRTLGFVDCHRASARLRGDRSHSSRGRRRCHSGLAGRGGGPVWRAGVAATFPAGVVTLTSKARLTPRGHTTDYRIEVLRMVHATRHRLPQRLSLTVKRTPSTPSPTPPAAMKCLHSIAQPMASSRPRARSQLVASAPVRASAPAIHSSFPKTAERSSS